MKGQRKIDSGGANLSALRKEKEAEVEEVAEEEEEEGLAGSMMPCVIAERRAEEAAGADLQKRGNRMKQGKGKRSKKKRHETERGRDGQFT